MHARTKYGRGRETADYLRMDREVKQSFRKMDIGKEKQGSGEDEVKIDSASLVKTSGTIKNGNGGTNWGRGVSAEVAAAASIKALETWSMPAPAFSKKRKKIRVDEVR